MPEEGGVGGGGHDGLLTWEKCLSWEALISDNLGGSNEEMGLARKKPPILQLPSSSNNSLVAVMENTNQVEIEMEIPSRKRGRGGGGGSRDGKGSGGKVKEGKGGESEHDQTHILTERERRKKMKTMFTKLHAKLPQLPQKADKSSIVDVAVNYIRDLQHTIQKLEKQKLERSQGLATISVGTSSSTATQNLEWNNSREAFLASQVSSSKSGAVEATNVNSSTAVLAPQPPVVFQTWTSSNVVLNICGDEAQISVCSLNKPGLFSTICYVLEKYNIDVVYAQASSDSTRRMFMIQAKVNRDSDQSTEAANIPVEDIYKQAATELMMLLSS